MDIQIYLLLIKIPLLHVVWMHVSKKIKFKIKKQLILSINNKLIHIAYFIYMSKVIENTP